MIRRISSIIIITKLVTQVLSQTCTTNILANTSIPLSQLNQKNSLLSQKKSESLEACYKDCCNSKGGCNVITFDSSPPSEQSKNNCFSFSITSEKYPSISKINQTLVAVHRVQSKNTTSTGAASTSPSATAHLSSTKATSAKPVVVTSNSTSRTKEQTTKVITKHNVVQVTTPLPNGASSSTQKTTTISGQRFISDEEHLLQQTPKVKEGWVGKYSENNITDKNASMTVSKNLLKTTAPTKIVSTSPATTVPPHKHGDTNITVDLKTPSTTITTKNITIAEKQNAHPLVGNTTKNAINGITSTKAVTSIRLNSTATPKVKLVTNSTASANLTLTTASPNTIVSKQNVTVPFNSSAAYLKLLKALLKSQGHANDTNKTEEVKEGWVGQFNQSNLIDKSANMSVIKANISYLNSTQNTTPSVTSKTTQPTVNVSSTTATKPTTTLTNQSSPNITTIKQKQGSNTTTPSLNITTQNVNASNSTTNTTTNTVPTKAQEGNKTDATYNVHKPVSTRGDSATSLQRSTISAALIAAMSFGVLFFVAVAALFTRKLYENWKHRHYSRIDFLVNGMYG